MKKNLKRMLAALLTLVMLTLCAAMAEPAGIVENAPDCTVEGRTYPYLRQFTDAEKYPTEGEMTLYFVNGGDIPYVALSEYMAFLSGLLKDLGKGEIAYNVMRLDGEGGDSFAVVRPDNDSTLLVDPAEDQLLFDNFNTFTQTVGTKALVSTMDMPEAEELDPLAAIRVRTEARDPDDGIQAGQDAAEEDPEESREDETVEAPVPESGEAPEATASKEDGEKPSLFALKSGMYLNRAGNNIALDLAEYDIDIVEADGECYIPFQTLNDLLVNDTYMQYVFDGEKVLGSMYGCALINEMDSAPKHAMSEAFARFNYNELCLLLDCKYGLKPEHGIDSFQTFLAVHTGLWEDLSSTDGMRSSYALIKLLFTYFDDLHSGFIRGSYLFDRDREMERELARACRGPSMRNMIFMDQRYKDARKAVYRAWVPGYEEVGDTAFITFDMFTVEREDYYDPTIDRDDPKDTIDLIIYANEQIKREGSPVKNIVLDLSNNLGGTCMAAIFVISWFLGEGDIAMRDTFTGAETNAMYLADVNLDGQFDEEDCVGEDYRLYCLTSNRSFSCGNLVPAACRSSGRVTLVGQTTGGGSCAVLPCTTAAGSVFQISGNKQVSIIKNGSFYNTDTGIEPDFPLDKPESFYDRPALVEYLHSLK